MKRSLHFGVVVAIVAAVAELGLAVEPQTPPSKASPNKAATASVSKKSIWQVLDEPTEFDFVATPLKDVVEALKIRHRINIVCDSKRMTDASITPDTEFTRVFKEVPLRVALSLMLSDTDLDFVVDGNEDSILITTAAEARRFQTVRRYDVRDLLTAGGNAADLMRTVRIAVPVSPLAFDEPLDATPSLATKALPGQVPSQENVSVFRNLLIVRTTTVGQFAVEQLLADLRKDTAEPKSDK